ncbi:hypothetical protein [Aureibacter tunicatorum]|uniref:Uncharacterized protein n=1 Tax=Aureibacter tunicatorum TaxID=866807 RepID=A0AAE3XSL1_9BACT|nr:hypothetical protein [Aureibacter tunicatorum]MDR6241745.1 hypothetical protein [Aureibacter tunicatorum]BDD07393.1 hypothetical protein AUTU_48760 [Aureibacter tunicatorum]
MKKVIDFINEVFYQEIITEYSACQISDDIFESELKKLNTYCTIKFKNKIVSGRSKQEASYYDQYKDIEMSNPRKLLKLSHYAGSEYGDVYVAYTTGVNPITKRRIRFMDCFFIIKEGSLWKFAKNYYFDDPMLVKEEWGEGPGENNITFETIGDFVETQRFIEPVDDDSKEDYWQDK